MSDIADVLKFRAAIAAANADNDSYACGISIAEAIEAADEIQRLRARVAELDDEAIKCKNYCVSLSKTINEQAAENESLRRDVEVYKDGLLAVVNLIESSLGVYGLHLNGELAPWDTLRTGGGYEDWLQSLDAAVDAIDKALEAR